MDSAGEGITAGLAKGFRLFDGLDDLSEEGMGFGVPVIVCGFRTYLSYTSRGADANRTFLMDAIQVVQDVKGRGNLRYIWLEAKGRAYKSLPFAQKIMLRKRSTGNLSPGIGFELCESIGEVSVTYKPDREGLAITVDLSGIVNTPGAPKIYILNEQGGRAFSFFREEGNGTRDNRDGLRGQSIGWKKVTGEKAGFTSENHRASFMLRRISGIPMYRGREVVDGILSWSGIEYDVTSLIGSAFTYRVDISGARLVL